MKSSPHISVKAETLFHLMGFPITNSFLTSIVVLILFLILAFFYSRSARKKNKGGLFYFITFILKSLYSLFDSIFGDKTKVFFPFLSSLFLFILLQNWFGLLPGVGSLVIESHGGEHAIPLLRAGTADLNMSLSLAVLTVVLIQFYGIKYLGAGQYLKKFIDFKSPLAFFTGILEIISEFSKVISFSFRLFGNIFAGEVLIVIIAFLIPILASFPFLLLEIFVGFIQAIVFTMLAAAFINLAITKHH